MRVREMGAAAQHAFPWHGNRPSWGAEAAGAAQAEAMVSMAEATLAPSCPTMAAMLSALKKRMRCFRMRACSSSSGVEKNECALTPCSRSWGAELQEVPWLVRNWAAATQPLCERGHTVAVDAAHFANP